MPSFTGGSLNKTAGQAAIAAKQSAVLTDATLIPVGDNQQTTLGALKAYLAGTTTVASAGTSGGSGSLASRTDQTTLMVYQRASTSGGAFGKGTASVPVSVTISGGTANLDVRFRDAVASGNPTLVDWQAGPTGLAAGTQTVNVTAPATDKWLLMDLRPSGQTSAQILGTQRFGVGEVVGVYGQSLVPYFAIGTGPGTDLASAGDAAPTKGSVIASQSTSVSPPWAVPADGGTYDGAGAVELINRLSATAGVLVGVVAHGRPGAPISLLAAGTGEYAQFVSNVQAAGGKIGTLLFIQGHGDALAGTTQSAYQAALTSLLGSLGSAVGPFNTVLNAIPAIETTSNGTMLQVDAIRAAQIAVAAANPSTMAYIACLDAVGTNGSVHPSPTGYVSMARHAYRAICGFRGLLAAGDKGPSVVSATRGKTSGGSPKKIVLTVAQNAGTTWANVGSLANLAAQFNVFTSGSGYSLQSAQLALDATTPIAFPSATEIDLFLAADPGDSVALDMRMREAPDTDAIVAALIRDNAVDSTDPDLGGRQLMLISGSINVAAPGVGTSLAVSAPSGSVATASTLTVSGTYGGAQPSGLQYALDGATSYTAASSPMISAPSGNSGTFSFSISMPATGSHTISVQETGTGTSASGSSSFSISSASKLLDSLSASPGAAYSMRKLRSAYTGAAIRVGRLTDSTEQDIGFTSGGDLDTAALLSFASGTTAVVKKWYDQSGNGRDAATSPGGNQNFATIATGGAVVTAGSGGRATFNCQNGNNTMSVTTALTAGAVSVVMGLTAGNGAAYPMPLGDGGGSFFPLYVNNGGSTALISAFSYPTAGQSPYVGNVQGAALPAAPGLADTYAATSSPVSLSKLVLGQGNSTWGGPISEVLVFAADVSSGDRTTIANSQGSYFGS